MMRRTILLVLLTFVAIAKATPGLGSLYTCHIYPIIARLLSPLPNLLPFAIGDVFIAASIAWTITYPIYAIAFKKRRKLPTFLNVTEYLLWVYVWLYTAWGLNYSQPNIYNRLQMRPVGVNGSVFRDFAYRYADSLNANYTDTASESVMPLTRQVVLQGYNHIHNMGINLPFNMQAHAKPMLFSRLSSMAGVTGSMGPFFCEFTINADVLPHDYPATYAHEYAHFLGIANEGEANFYSYIVCTSSADRAVRFSGYYQIFFHVMRNVRDLLGEAGYKAFTKRIRPEIIRLADNDRRYWIAHRCPIVDTTQNFFYNLYLKDNHMEDGMRSYSGVIGIIMAWEKNEEQQ